MGIASLILPFALMTPLWAQVPPVVSPLDQQLVIRTLSLLPPQDNVSGIYSNPATEDLQEFFAKNHQFSLQPLPANATLPDFVTLRDNPSAIAEVLKAAGSDSLLAIQILKGAKGVSLQADLFWSGDGELLVTQSVKDLNRFETSEIKAQTRALVQRLLKSLPYAGLVLSRSGNKVTLNLGKRDGIKEQQSVDAVMLLQVQKHPKFRFMVSSEKEIIGKLKIFKVDETLSFAQIQFEKERDLIQRNTKIGPIETVTYPDKELAPVSSTPTNQDRKEWVPAPTPTFGQAGLRLGLGSYRTSTTLDSGVGGLEGSTLPYPSFTVMAELWLNPQWMVRGNIREALASYKNPRANSTPQTLTASNSTYSLVVGYNFLLYNDFWGPKLSLLGGYAQFNSSVTSSTPTAMTTMRYGGLQLGVEGSLPLDDDRIYSLGANYFFVWRPKLTESPELTGRDDLNSMTTFSLFGRKKMMENLHLVLSLEFEMYSTAWSRAGTRTDGVSGTSAAHTIQTLNGGINYLF